MKSFLTIFCLLFSAQIGRAAEFLPPRPIIQPLANGLKLYLLPDRELPTFEAVLTIPAGRLYDPKGKEGTALLTADLLRSGGTVSKTADQVDHLFDFAGASLNFETAHEYQAVSLHCLRKDREKLLSLLFEIIAEPRFDKDRFSISKARVKEGILRQDEDPLERALREFQILVYGAGNRWGAKPTLQSIKKIERDGLLEFHGRFFNPQGSFLAVSGDFDPKEIVRELERSSKIWINRKSQKIEPEPIREEFNPKTVLLPEALSQTTLILGHLGEKRTNPDKFPLIVMNYILGGSSAMTSRLGEEIRSKLGKAYLVWSDFGFGKDRGLFKIIAQTENTNVPLVLEKIQEAIVRMASDPQITDEELKRAKRSIVTSLIFQHENRFQIVKNRALFDFLGYPPDYLEIYKREIERVTKKEIVRVSKKYLHPEGLKVLIVGPKNSSIRIDKIRKSL
ncbi:MAG: insulinase family protein [Deltaproteobacteria bacterium]|nr:insulinase family protein [Deltaproteobacteria bacterium]